MDIIQFSHLKEVQSLDKMIKKHLDIIQEQSARRDYIVKIRHTRETEKEGLLIESKDHTASINQFEKELFDWEKKLEKALEQLPMAKSEQQINALQKEQSMAEENVEHLQDKILSLLEEQEILESKIEECISFLKGSKLTLDTIDKEILEVTQVEQNEIDKYEIRIKALLEDVPDTLKLSFLKARKKHRFNQPLSRVMQGGCEKCRFILDKMTQSRIELLQTVEVCSQCERLLIPYNA
ncbi:MAG: hypothetical protein K9K67_07850 [Bacteriovoracaceae bacterium]|nr:hypothetical protein [Bacteriovoracaceae bacterium]